MVILRYKRGGSVKVWFRLTPEGVNPTMYQSHATRFNSERAAFSKAKQFGLGKRELEAVSEEIPQSEICAEEVRRHGICKHCEEGIPN